MRNLILTLTLLIGFFGYAQKPKVEALRYKEVTTAERDAFTVPNGEHWKIYNTTTAQFEYWDGDSWEVVSGATVSDAVYDGTWDADTEGASKNALFDKIESVIAGVGTGATPQDSTAVGTETEWVVTGAITSSHKLFVSGIKLIEGTDYTQTGSTFTFTGYSPVAGHEWEYFPDIAVPTSGGGDALTTDPLSQFAQTTKAQLNGVISDGTPLYVGDVTVPDNTDYVDLTSNQTKAGVLSFNNTSGVSTNGISIENSSATGTSYGLKVLNSNNSFDGQSGVLFENTGLGYAGITSIPSGNGGGQYILGNATYTGIPLKYQKTGGNSFTVDANANVTANSFIGDGSGLTNLPNDVSEYITSTGTRAGDDLYVTIGDYDNSNNNTHIGVEEFERNIKLSTFSFQVDNGVGISTISSTLLSGNRNLELPDASGTIATEAYVDGLSTSTASAVTTQIINLDNPSGDVYYTAEWNATYTTANLVARGWAKIAIDTTGQTVFPTITGATLRTGADFVATETFDMIVGTDDGTNVYYYFLAR